MLKPKTLLHLAAAKRNRLQFPKTSYFNETKEIKAYLRKCKKSRKALADKLRLFRKESHHNARLWHRA